MKIILPADFEPVFNNLRSISRLDIEQFERKDPEIRKKIAGIAITFLQTKSQVGSPISRFLSHNDPETSLTILSEIEELQVPIIISNGKLRSAVIYRHWWDFLKGLGLHPTRRISQYVCLGTQSITLGELITRVYGSYHVGYNNKCRLVYYHLDVLPAEYIPELWNLLPSITSKDVRMYEAANPGIIDHLSRIELVGIDKPDCESFETLPPLPVDMANPIVMLDFLSKVDGIELPFEFPDGASWERVGGAWLRFITDIVGSKCHGNYRLNSLKTQEPLKKAV